MVPEDTAPETTAPNSTFEVVFEIHPASVFGLPQKGMTVLPSTPGTFVGDSWDQKTGDRRSYGTLSRYREAADAIKVGFSLDQMQARLHDNILYVTVQGQRAPEAYHRAVAAVDRFLQHLTLDLGHALTFKPLHIIAEGGLQPNPFGSSHKCMQVEPG